MALILALTGRSLLAVQVVQAVLGAGHAVLLGLFGDKMMGRRAGIIAGFLTAIYGPFVVGNVMILCEGPGMFLAAGGLYLVLRALECTMVPPQRYWQLAWVGAGLVLGLGGIIKETGVILFGSVWHSSRVRKMDLESGLC